MIIGKVIDNIVSTRKYAELQGYKLLIVQQADKERLLVAVDEIGAGIGEYVLVTTGYNVQVTLGKKAPVDALIIGIIDNKPVILGN